MNWYKKHIYAGIPSTTQIDFLYKLKLFGIVRGRKAGGSHVMYINPYLNKSTPISIGADGDNIGNGIEKKVGNELGIPWSIWKKLPKRPRRKEVRQIENQLPWFKQLPRFQSEIQEIEEPEEQKVPDYQSSVWFQNQQKQQRQLEEEKLRPI